MLILWAGCIFKIGSKSGQLFQMSILVAIDEAEPLDRPVQPRCSRQRVLSSALAGRIGMLMRVSCIILAARAWAVRVIDIEKCSPG